MPSCCVTRPSDESSHSRRQTASDLVFFVHDFMCPREEQLPMEQMVAAAGDDMRIRRKIADQMNQVASGGVVWRFLR